MFGQRKCPSSGFQAFLLRAGQGEAGRLPGGSRICMLFASANIETVAPRLRFFSVAKERHRKTSGREPHARALGHPKYRKSGSQTFFCG